MITIDIGEKELSIQISEKERHELSALNSREEVESYVFECLSELGLWRIFPDEEFGDLTTADSFTTSLSKNWEVDDPEECVFHYTNYQITDWIDELIEKKEVSFKKRKFIIT